WYYALQIHLGKLVEWYAAQLAFRREETVLQHLGDPQAKYLLRYLLIRSDSLADTTPLHGEANAPRMAAPINGPVTHTLQLALSSPSDLSFIVRSVSRCSARSCSMLAPVCLALVRSYAVSFGLVVLLSFGFVFAFLVITPFTLTPIPGKHGVSHATSFQVNIDGGTNQAW